MKAFTFSILSLFLSIILSIFLVAQTTNQLKLVVNEIDYDQTSTDNSEWLEVTGVVSTSLTDILVVLVNGADNSIYRTINLDTYSIPNSTSKVTGGDGNEWDFFVIGASSVSNIDLIPTGWTSDQIQNGSPDGILLAYDSNNNDTFDEGTDIILDAVAYENGAGATGFSTLFGSTRAPADNNTDAASSIGRDGEDLDTGDNSVDFTYSGVNGSTPGTLNANQNASSLPVELSSFSAVILDKGVKLNWRTETEVSNYGFEVQKSEVRSQESEWKTIGFVHGHGNSNSPKDYSFIDDLTLTPNPNLTLCYRLKQIDTDGKFEYSKVVEVDLDSPTKFELSQNYPNPFNPSTTISFSLPQSGNLKLTVYNLLGEQVAELVNGFKEAGIHIVNFNASDLNSGVFIYKLEANGVVQSKKMTLVK